jgi:FkbM family methyltransferase
VEIAMSAVNLPSLQHALTRLSGHNLGIKSMISLGAGRGDDTPAFLKVWPGADPLMIEMDEQFEKDFQSLQKRIPNLRYDICAAAGEDRQGLQLKTNKVGGAIVSDPNANVEGARPVAFKRLDSLVREHGLKAPHFLKFDTHGAELEILSGAQQTLADTALIMMECYNFKLRFMDFKNLTFDEMSLHMKGLGFRCIDMCDPLYRPGDHALWQMHLFFIRSDHPTFERTSYGLPKPA